MRHFIKKNLTTWILLILVAVSGCGTGWVRADELESLAPMVKNLSRAAEVFGDIQQDLQGMEFLRKATDYDPGLLTPFASYDLSVLRIGRHVAILVCDKGKSVAFFEDVGCTAPLDRNFVSEPRSGCIFTLDVTKLCGDGVR